MHFPDQSFRFVRRGEPMQRNTRTLAGKLERNRLAEPQIAAAARERNVGAMGSNASAQDGSGAGRSLLFAGRRIHPAGV
jgi:hypothetical protein